MADPFGIIGVVGVAGQLIQIGVRLGLDWKDAPDDAKSFMAELQALKTVLSETNTNVILNQDFVDAFHGRHSTLLSQFGAPAPTDTQMMVSACRVELESLLEDFRKRAQGHRVGWERLKGAFHATKTREAVENLHRQCVALNNLVAIDAVALAASTHREVKESRREQQQMHSTLNQLRDRHDSREACDEQKNILDWLTPVDFAPQQLDFINRRQAGTGQWLLDSAQFKAWVEADKQTLFCPGIPGAGKTILTSIVVDELTTRLNNDESIGLAYVYCNFRRQDEQGAGDLLASLLKQLAQDRPSLPDSVRSLYERHKGKRTRPSYDEISRALRSVAALYSRVFVTVDALDECQAIGGCRAKLLSEIFDLQAKSGVNVFATSRFIPEITEKFEGSLSLEIRASEHDVRRYVDGHISHLPSFVRRSPDLQEEIKSEIIKAVDGMFLLAQLHLDSLIGKRSPKAVRTALVKLPRGSEAYDRAYDDAMDRIEGQVGDQAELAKQVLSWITCAKRPLTTLELRHALAVEAGASELDEDNLPQIEDMVSVCAGLATVDEESGIIRLVHYTTQEYFERMQKHQFPNAQTDITTVCATYLSFSVFESGFCQSDAEFEERLRLNPLYGYAAQHWGHHAREANTVSQGVITFLESQRNVEASSQALRANKGWGLPGYSQQFPRQTTGLHLVACLGVNGVLADMLHGQKHDIDSKDSDGRTPLSYAAGRNHTTVAKLLLERGADVNSKDQEGQTPLLCAVRRGYIIVTKLLLEKGADVDLKDSYNQTPLLCAIKRNYITVTKLLLDKGAEVDLKNEYNRTPLLYAAGRGYEAIVKLLLDKGAKVDSRDNCKRTPLLHAATEGYEAIVKLLLDKGAKVDPRDNHKRTPLLHGAREGHEAIVKLLLDRSAEVNSRDNYKRTPLSYAARGGHEAIVKLLLERGADADLKSKSRGTPLFYATAGGYEAIVALLRPKR